MSFTNTMVNLWNNMGFSTFTWQQGVMIGISLILLFLAIGKKFEPFLLLPIAFGMLLVNLPLTGLTQEGGLFYYLSFGVNTSIYPCLIFLGIGAMTDFGPLLANPSCLLLGAASQLGVYVTFIVACFAGFTPQEAAAIGIIGGADGPVTIYLTATLANHLLPMIAVAAYSYMALVPLIQPPLIHLLTTKKERSIEMHQLRVVTRKEKIIFPIVVILFTCLLFPSIAPLLGMFMLGNLLRESGVTNRLSDTAQNSMMNMFTLLLGISIGSRTAGNEFLQIDTLIILGLGLLAFCISTIGGLLFGKLMCVITKGKINPLIGSAGVAAVPMAARISQVEGRKVNPSNFLLMHAMGPNVAESLALLLRQDFCFQSLAFFRKEIIARPSNRNKFHSDVIIHVSFMVHRILSPFWVWIAGAKSKSLTFYKMIFRLQVTVPLLPFIHLVIKITV